MIMNIGSFYKNQDTVEKTGKGFELTLREEKMMKRKYILGLFLLVLAIWLTGCSSQLGETRDEIKRRHTRSVQINSQELMDDIDKALLFDEPSKLTDKRIQ
jgi:hypothetical protein